MSKFKIEKELIYKVGEKTFNTKEEAQEYINQTNKQKETLRFNSEDEMIEFLLKQKDFKDMYEKTKETDFKLLANDVHALAILIDEKSKEQDFHYNYYHTYNELFNRFRTDAAIKRFKSEVKDIELSDEKITEIYDKMKGDWISTPEYADEEIDEFSKLIYLLK